MKYKNSGLTLKILAALAFCTFMCNAPPVFAADPAGELLKPTREMQVHSKFTNDDGDKLKNMSGSQNMSGIACTPPSPEQSRLCVVIDDESREAQVAILDQSGLKPGHRIKLISKKEPNSIVGSAPTGDLCREADGFDDLDGEGVAYAAPFFYIVGSHGCTRKKGKFRPSVFITVQLKLNSEGNLVRPDGSPLSKSGDETEAVQTSYRLAEALARVDKISPFFAKELNKDGLNVEGVAVVDGRLLAGLRAPSVGGNAFIVSVPVEELFAQDPATGKAAVIELPLGAKVGIRDMAALPDGRLLILSGPTEEDKEVHFGLHIHRISPQLTNLIGFIDNIYIDNEDGNKIIAKAEAVLPVEFSSERLKMIIMFDGIENGGPREYIVKLP